MEPNMPGPRKKPTVLEELHGRPGHRKRNPLEPKPGGDLLTPPAWLSKAQREEWRYIVENSVPGLLTSVDRANLTAYVVAACLHRQAARELEKADGLVVAIGEKGAQQQHPLISIINRQALIMIKAAAEMGFTPASRTRVSANGEIAPPNARPPAPDAKPAPAGGLKGFIASNPDGAKHD
jgi:P27 family predicted phage terminase small subunit